MVSICTLDFPGGPVVETLLFQCRRYGFHLYSGSQDPMLRGMAKKYISTFAKSLPIHRGLYPEFFLVVSPLTFFKIMLFILWLKILFYLLLSFYKNGTILFLVFCDLLSFKLCVFIGFIRVDLSYTLFSVDEHFSYLIRCFCFCYFEYTWCLYL